MAPEIEVAVYTGPCRNCGAVNFPGSFGAKKCPACAAKDGQPIVIRDGILVELKRAAAEYRRLHPVGMIALEGINEKPRRAASRRLSDAIRKADEALNRDEPSA